MKLLMISGDRKTAAGQAGAFMETLKELHKHFDRIDVICPAIGVGQKDRILFNNIFFHPASRGLFWHPFFITKKGRELFEMHHHDVMTIHEYPPFYNGLGARWLKKQTGIPAVLEIHHLVGWPKASSLSEWIGRLMSRLFLSFHTRAFDAVRVVNGTVKTTLKDWGVEMPISVVPSLYLDHELVQAATDTPKTVDLVFCARLVQNKGLFAVLRAVASLPAVSLLIVGDGPLRVDAEAFVRTHSMTDRVRFTGWLPTQVDVLQAMASGKIFIMNSLSEGGPRSAVEAMALGLPVLATRVGVMSDIVHDGVNGMFTDGSSEDVAVKISVLLSDDALQASMGKKAREVLGLFEKKAAVKAYADFLHATASRS
jgi:glycosyltransferase involved in cell wall biosynthesis